MHECCGVLKPNPTAVANFPCFSPGTQHKKHDPEEGLVSMLGRRVDCKVNMQRWMWFCFYPTLNNRLITRHKPMQSVGKMPPPDPATPWSFTPTLSPDDAQKPQIWSVSMGQRGIIMRKIHRAIASMGSPGNEQKRKIWPVSIQNSTKKINRPWP